ncbi:aminotransferase-like domain-containing protein [Aestuariispira ectoiniformans]|uniref:aminotransferase-like domain-containing protein n=1 Tax=Aestuariispira ectoiniformans TaxID=2775080 RepID=UPI00223B69BB|nr:PLP-dependent aminotransferase family protein [Aestuariispira ectoiniformans]
MQYQKVIGAIEEQYQHGILNPGDKLPSLRQMAQHMSVSLNTVIRAYQELEANGTIRALPRSGYIVEEQLTTPLAKSERLEPRDVDTQSLILSVLRDASRKDLVHMGSAHPRTDFPAVDKLYRIIARQARQQVHQISHYRMPAASLTLRQAIARQHALRGEFQPPSDILITQGAQQALSATLQALTAPGDVIAVESPCYFGTLLSLEAHGLKVIEVPTNTRDGMDLDALADVLRQWPVKAVLTAPTVNNPAGFTMPEAARRRLLALTGDLPIIEDDVYSDVSFGDIPPTLRSMDNSGRVVCLSSLSKSVDSRLRLGWITGGRYQDRIERSLIMANLGNVNLISDGVTDFLQAGLYQKHLRKIRRHYKGNFCVLRDALSSLMDLGCCLTQPTGGFLCWLRLPEAVDGYRIYEKALAAGIATSPGRMFSVSNLYPNYIRLNYAFVENNPHWQASLDRLVKIIAEGIEP